MASSREYLDYILDRLSGMDGVSHRAMMGEFIIYYQGKVIGGIYDDRFLVKPTKSAEAILPDAPRELPYEGAKPMLMVDNPDDGELLRRLIVSVAEDLPEPKRKKK
jgi:TfoX/Sxy family transcriptional regulator of competence genes